jgi:uncharacterized OsmC-like protein
MQMQPTITVESENPSVYSHQTTIRWMDAEFNIHGDNPVAHHGDGTGPDGFDLLGAAIGQCMTNTLVASARREGIPLSSVTAEVATKSRLQGSDRAPYISDFQVELFVDGDLDESQRARLEELTKAMCGVRETLMQTPTIVESVQLRRAGEVTATEPAARA